MARLSTKQRKKLPSSSFAGPGRTYPVNDAEHARKAIQLAALSLKKGNITKAQYDAIVAKARRKLKGNS